MTQEEHQRNRRAHHRRQRCPIAADERQQKADQHGAGGNSFRQQVERHVEAPRLHVRRVVVDARRAGLERIRRRRSQRAQQHLAFLVDERARRRFRADDAVVSAEIEDLRERAFLRLADLHRLHLRDLRDLARRIVEVAEDAAFGRADADTRRQQLVLDAVRAEVAFLGGMRVRIDEQLIVRAGHHAGAAADAGVAVQIDDAVAPTVERVGRTDPRAGRVVALVAEDREKESAGVGEGAFLDGLDPTAIDADRNLVLGFAGDRARVTPDALAKVDGEPVVGHAGWRIYHAEFRPQSHRDTETERDDVARPTGGAGRERIRNAPRKTQSVDDLSALCFSRSVPDPSAASRRRATATAPGV